MVGKAYPTNSEIGLLLLKGSAFSSEESLVSKKWSVNPHGNDPSELSRLW